MSPKNPTTVNQFDHFFIRHFISSMAGLVLTASWILALPTSAQPELPVRTLEIGGKKINAEIADEPSECEAGLMFRKSLAENSGMLFVMATPGPAGFWMKNTAIPLTVAYIDKGGRIVEMHDMNPHDEKIVASNFPHIAYALEMPQGWFVKNNIWPGERINGLP